MILKNTKKYSKYNIKMSNNITLTDNKTDEEIHMKDNSRYDPRIIQTVRSLKKTTIKNPEENNTEKNSEESKNSKGFEQA